MTHLLTSEKYGAKSPASWPGWFFILLSNSSSLCVAIRIVSASHFTNLHPFMTQVTRMTQEFPAAGHGGNGTLPRCVSSPMTRLQTPLLERFQNPRSKHDNAALGKLLSSTPSLGGRGREFTLLARYDVMQTALNFRSFWCAKLKHRLLGGSAG